MARTEQNQYSIRPANNPLRSLSPKTVTAVVLMALMGILWLRVLTGGGTGPAVAQAAEEPTSDQTENQSETPLRIEPKTLPVIDGRHNVLVADFFTSSGWPQLRQPDEAPSKPVDDVAAKQRQQKERFESLVQGLHLDAVLRTGDGAAARACIEGHVLSQGQSLTLKKNTETYELTVSEIGDNQVVLTWGQWSAVLKMAESEHVD